MTITETPDQTNGIDLEHILGARQALTDAPPAAEFTWKGSCEWVRGTHSRTSIDGFFGLGAEQTRSGGGFTYDTDHPEHFGSADQGATPIEVVLAGLAGCLTGGIASVAANRGITLHSVKATVEGDVNLQGIMGIDPDVRNGFSAVRVTYTIDADATDDEIRAVVAQSQKRSAVYDVVTNPTVVTVAVA